MATAVIMHVLCAVLQNRGRTPFYIAVLAGSLDVVQLFLHTKDVDIAEPTVMHIFVLLW